MRFYLISVIIFILFLSGCSDTIGNPNQQSLTISDNRVGGIAEIDPNSNHDDELTLTIEPDPGFKKRAQEAGFNFYEDVALLIRANKPGIFTPIMESRLIENTTNKIWITSATTRTLALYYEDEEGYLRTSAIYVEVGRGRRIFEQSYKFSGRKRIAKINYKDYLSSRKQDLVLWIKHSPGDAVTLNLKAVASGSKAETLSTHWSLDEKRNIIGLGHIPGSVEPSEVGIDYKDEHYNVGSRTSDYRTNTGIIIEKTALNSISDRVKIRIPALLDDTLPEEIIQPPEPPREDIITFRSKQGTAVFHDGHNIALHRVNSDGSVGVLVDGVSLVIGDGKNKAASGVKVQNYDQFYDTYLGDNSFASLLIEPEHEEVAVEKRTLFPGQSILRGNQLITLDGVTSEGVAIVSVSKRQAIKQNQELSIDGIAITNEDYTYTPYNESLSSVDLKISNPSVLA